MPKLLAVMGRKGSGKSQVLEELITILTADGYRVGVIKRLAKDDQEVDQPGKDTFRYRMQGAATVMLAGRKRLAIFSDLHRELPLETLLLSFQGFDLVFLEDYFLESIPILEIHLKESGGPPLCQSMKKPIFALCSDAPAAHVFPQFSMHQLPHLAVFIEGKLLRSASFNEVAHAS